MPSVHRLLYAAIVLAAIALSACKKGGDGKAAPPAKVDKPAKEADIGAITLTEEAERRLGVKTEKVEKKAMPRARTLGGEAMVPNGARAVVAAPVSGTLALAGDAPRPGAVVEKGKPLFVLSLTSAEKVRFAESKTALASARAEAEAAVARAKVEVEAAKITLERAERLATEQVGSTQQLDNARAQDKLARAGLAAAEARRNALAQIGGDPGAAPIAIDAPLAGVILSVHAQPGQVVPAGAPLVEIVETKPIWIRVPVYAGDLASIDRTKDALIEGLAEAAGEGPKAAKPVSGPPSASLASASVDLYYELSNERGEVRPGQNVSVIVPLKSEVESLVVPWASVLHDIHAGTWVYERTGPRAYMRRRVHVRYVTGAFAVLASGPMPGKEVVTDGAAELFGAEFGVGK